MPVATCAFSDRHRSSCTFATPSSRTALLEWRDFASARSQLRECVSPILDARTGRAACDLISVTVGAANCVTADALTKVVFALREQAAPLLARYSADALLLEQGGRPSWMFNSTCETLRQT